MSDAAKGCANGITGCGCLVVLGGIGLTVLGWFVLLMGGV
jgi:hypothetical protein